MFVTILAVSLFICSSYTISQISPKYNQDNTIINYEIDSKDTNIIPSASETYNNTSNTVNWCIYEDGTLVINGPNTVNYKGYGTIFKSGKDLDLNKNYSFRYGIVPWSESGLNIQQVEFTEKTQPT